MEFRRARARGALFHAYSIWDASGRANEQAIEGEREEGGGRAANGKGRKRGGGGRRRRRMALMPQIVMTSIDTKGYLSVRHGVSELRTSVGRFKETTDINQHMGFKTRMARLLQDFLIAS